MSNCCVIGLGYIGLPTAVVLAEAGHKVLGVDVNKTIVDKINKGNVHIFEPGLEDSLRNAVINGLIIAKTEPAKSDVFVIAVPTPFINDKNINEKNKIPKPNIEYVLSAAKSLAPFLDKGNLVIIESTIDESFL